MFRNTYQSGFVSILHSLGSKPLIIWRQEVRNGHIKRVSDDESKALAIEIMGTNVTTTFISCPPGPRETLAIRLPFFVMVVKNMKKYFTFEIQILDDKNQSRRFRVSNFQSTTRVNPFCTSMPIGLTSGWNQIQFNLADFTRRAYGTTYLETQRVQIHANVRIRRIYFADRLYSDDEMPAEYRLIGGYAGKPRPKPARVVVKKGKGGEATDTATGKPGSGEVIPSGALPTPIASMPDVTADGSEAKPPASEGESEARTDAYAETLAYEGEEAPYPDDEGEGFEAAPGESPADAPDQAPEVMIMSETETESEPPESTADLDSPTLAAYEHAGDSTDVDDAQSEGPVVDSDATE